MKFTDYESWKKMSTEEKKELLKEAGFPMESEEGKIIADVIDLAETKGWTPACADCTYERCPDYEKCTGYDLSKDDEDVRDMKDSEYDSEEEKDDDEDSEYAIAERKDDVPILIHSSDQRVERIITNKNGEEQLIAADSEEELDKIEEDILAGIKLTDGKMHYNMYLEDRGIFVDCVGKTVPELLQDIEDAKKYFGIK